MKKRTSDEVEYSVTIKDFDLLSFYEAITDKVVFINVKFKEDTLKALGDVTECKGRYFYKNAEFVFNSYVPDDKAYCCDRKIFNLELGEIKPLEETE